MNIQKLVEGIKVKDLEDGQYVVVSPTQFYSVEEYLNNEIPHDNVIAVVNVVTSLRKSEFLYPILFYTDSIVDIALSKLQFTFKLFDLYYSFPVNPKYLVYVTRKGEQIIIEVIDVDNAISITNADRIIAEIISSSRLERELSIEEHSEIRKRFLSQMFAGYRLYEVREILYKYYDENEKELENEIEKIVNEYYKTFKPLKFYF